MVWQRLLTLLQLTKTHKLLKRVESKIGSVFVRPEVVRAFAQTLYPENNWQDIFNCWIVISNSHHYGSIRWNYTHCCHLVIPCIWMYLSSKFWSPNPFSIQNHYILIWLRIFWLWKLKITNFDSCGIGKSTNCSTNCTYYRFCYLGAVFNNQQSFMSCILIPLVHIPSPHSKLVPNMVLSNVDFPADWIPITCLS